MTVDDPTLPRPGVPATPAWDAATLAHLRAAPAARAARTSPWFTPAVAALAGLVVLAVLAVLAVGVLGGDPPTSVQAATLRLPDGTEVDTEALIDIDDATTALEGTGITLDVEEVPVAAPTVGLIFELRLEYAEPPPAGTPPATVVLPRGETIHLVVGRAPRGDEEVTTEGLSYTEADPRICDVLDLTDARATAAGLAALGYEVDAIQEDIEPSDRDDAYRPVGSQEVDEVPEGAVVLHLGRPDGADLTAPIPPGQVVMRVTTDRSVALPLVQGNPC